MGSVAGGVKTRTRGTASHGASKDAAPPSYTREASHAGSWYTDDGDELSEQLKGWVVATGIQANPKARAVIAPHAGYRYSGAAAAHAFAHMHKEGISRIFLLGPSHHHFTRKCVLPQAAEYNTPIGPFPLDTEVLSALSATGEFEHMGRHVDEAEHSLEMHLPYLRHMCQGRHVSLVPIMVGSLDAAAEEKYAKLLASYFADTANFFSISSDFCHWGARFHFTPHHSPHGPIHKSIEALDREGMAAIASGAARPFCDYISRTGNTICGRHPIGVLLQLVQQSPSPPSIRFVHYEQSSKCHTMRDSSVSYASAVVLQ